MCRLLLRTHSPLLEPPDPWDYPSSRRTKYYSICAPTSTPSVLQLHLLPAGHLVVQQQCKACHGSLWILLPTRGISFISAGQASLHLRSDLRAICAPTSASSVLQLDLLAAGLPERPATVRVMLREPWILPSPPGMARTSSGGS